MNGQILSRLTQARGLKRVTGLLHEHEPRLSRLTQARGLKLRLGDSCTQFGGVAPHAGAWIETLQHVRAVLQLVGRASRRRVD